MNTLRRRFSIPVHLLFFAGGTLCFADALPQVSWERALPILQGKCFECHGGRKTKGGVDLKRLEKDPAVSSEYALWEKVVDFVGRREMPPEDASGLSDAERNVLVGWAQNALGQAALTNAGDPGPVTLRRLTNREYDHAIRDLTGHVFGFGRDFVPDGGGGEGFTNIGDALFMSPQQLDKYFVAARKVAERATILPGTGIRFHPQHVGMRGPAQVKSDAEHALVVWYQKMAEPALPKDDEDLRAGEYILACWKWKHREQTAAPSLDGLAQSGGLNASFLQNWWRFLETEGTPSRFLDLIRIPWRELPAPDPAAPSEVPQRVRERIGTMQDHLRAWFLPRKWPVLRAQQDADELRSYEVQIPLSGGKTVHLVLGDLGDGNRGDLAVFSQPEITRKGKKQSYIEWIRAQILEDRNRLAQLAGDSAGAQEQKERQTRLLQAEKLESLLGKHPLGLDLDPAAFALQAPVVFDLPVPADATDFKVRAKLESRSSDVVYASIQWMLTAGEPPDPSRILPGVLTVWKRGSETQARVAKDFAPLHTTFSLNLEHRLNQVAQNRFRGGKPGASIYYFSDDQLLSFASEEQAEQLKALREDWRFVKDRTVPQALEPEWDAQVALHLEGFAQKAWRRPVLPGEKEELAAIYRGGRELGMDRESAAREALVRVLVAPDFLFKLEQSQGSAVHPVSAWELASRLSFFLWASIPDAALRARAEDGSLLKAEVLRSETLRMLRDPKAEGLARQFVAQWLDFQSFETESKVDTGKFPEFTPELRRDLFEEAIVFLSHIIRQNRPVREILSADYTFLNERLARHYGVPGVVGEGMRLTKVDTFARGGVLGMGAVLTRTAYPHRTSPVLRGNWLLRNVLGTPTPPPPNDVPKLDEKSGHSASLRERLQQHRSDKACAGCHDKIDPLGFALEAFDPIGRFRERDESGAPIDDSARDKEGRLIAGAAGLRAYLREHEPEFNALFARKLVGYALGRPVLATDKVLLDAMKQNLQGGDASFAGAVLGVVESKQFRNRRSD